MITSQDCLLLLAEINDSTEYTKSVIADGVTIDVIKFINESRPFDIAAFYEKMRKSYNAKKSQLYGNIVKEKEDIDSVLTTLSSLQLQIILFSKHLDDKQQFLRQARLDEISYCIYNYSKTFDLIPCIKLLRLIKADLCAFEYINGRRRD